MAVSQGTQAKAFVGRLLWLLIGPAICGIAAYQILTSGTGWLTGVDLAFGLALTAMLYGRYLEFQGGNPMTSTGEPATPEHLHRYWLVAGSSGVLVWIVANALGNHVLPG